MKMMFGQWGGTVMGLMCALLAFCQYVSGNELLFEQPAYGHMRATFFWQFLLATIADHVITHLCGYILSGPVYLKPTVFLFKRSSTFWHRLYRPCTCTTKHVLLQGALTTLAAAYPDGLCDRITSITAEHMPEGPGPWLQHGEEVLDELAAVGGFHDCGVRTDRRPAVSKLYFILLSEALPWRANIKYRFQQFGHFNIQEGCAVRGIC